MFIISLLTGYLYTRYLLWPGCSHRVFCLLNILSSTRLSNVEIRKASKLLRPTQLIGFDVIFSFVIKGCSDMLVPFHKYLLHLSLCP